MTPPRDLDPASGVNENEAVYLAVVDELSEVQGVINAAHGRVVELARRALEVGVSGGDSLTERQWVAWQTGAAPAQATSVVLLAQRAHELPHTVAALAAGSLSLDQAGEVARHVAAEFDESASRVASCMTVKQLRVVLPAYGPDDDAEEDRPAPSVSSGYDRNGYHLNARNLPEAAGAVVDQALKAMFEDLKRQARDAAPEGTAPEPVTRVDALVAMAEAALASGQAQRPGTERYLVHLHLEQGAHGIQLMTHLGIPVPDGQRRHLLCDARIRTTFHDAATGAPLNAGRATRDISRRLRRAIEHRDRGCCSVPGCGRTSGLEIHHIWHWEDGGPTDTANLITLCTFHHSQHHKGLLGIEGNADLARHTAPGVVFTNRWGRPIDPSGVPVPPVGAGGASERDRIPDAAARNGLATPRYEGPTGEKLDRWGFHLQASDPPPTPDDPDDPDRGEPEPPPGVTGRTPSEAPDAGTGRTGDTPADPTRAGPTGA